eukprot:gene9167-10119_t
MKPIEEVAIEELLTYTAITMSDSYFSSEVYPDVLYKTLQEPYVEDLMVRVNFAGEITVAHGDGGVRK